jgi:hypothetical protein
MNCQKTFGKSHTKGLAYLERNDVPDIFLKKVAYANVQKQVFSFPANVKKIIHFWLNVGIIGAWILYFLFSFAGTIRGL